MSKNITVTLTPAQQRALNWAVSIWEASYENSESADADFRRSLKAIDRLLATFPTN